MHLAAASWYLHASIIHFYPPQCYIVTASFILIITRSLFSPYNQCIPSTVSTTQITVAALVDSMRQFVHTAHTFSLECLTAMIGHYIAIGVVLTTIRLR